MRALLMREFAWTGPGKGELVIRRHLHSLTTGAQGAIFQGLDISHLSAGLLEPQFDRRHF